jgi:hypothetical protein
MARGSLIGIDIWQQSLCAAAVLFWGKIALRGCVGFDRKTRGMGRVSWLGNVDPAQEHHNRYSSGYKLWINKRKLTYVS